MKRLSFPVLALLVACGTPQEQCIARVTRDLRTVDKLIAEAEGNLARGYAYEEYTVSFPVFEPCLRPGKPTPENPSPPPVAGTCRDTREETLTRPKAIDLAAEARTLDQLKAKRRQLARASEPGIAQCRAEFPE
ncbi:hypothetical protein LHP98_15780 [Rhodobacter sp. Har01]|uniref:hypothetical protein n=1 Tax=Rhodobacter sp. Har01 TaxID=2883999 RepID=UPI001D06D0FB|nr:hypothetical protein [Rhodobacter sp. Har01]MCB6179582.1 hypothetical protein [Rhodobacter sp. Har01]